MNQYRSNRFVVLLIDLIAILVSFVVAIGIRYQLLIERLGSVLIASTYFIFLIIAIVVYVFLSLIRENVRLEKLSLREIVLITFEQQIVFIATYLVLFFMFHRADVISRVVVVIFFIGSVICDSVGRIGYHEYCVKKKISISAKDNYVSNNISKKSVQHVYIVGSKSIGQYGGFESFVMNLLKKHQNEGVIKYHVACKANGSGFMDISKLPGAVRVNDKEFSYCNAHCFLVDIPEKMGAAQAIYYDLEALKWTCEHIEKNHIEHPIVYILASRVGPFEKKYVKRIHESKGLVYQNPDGHEDWRRKWNPLIRKYWKYSEGLSIKYSDLVVCDSLNIEAYIKSEYANYNPNTVYIAYGSDLSASKLEDDDTQYINWLLDHDLRDGEFYVSVGRFVPENNFEIMIREFMRSNTTKDFAIITTEDTKYAAELQQKLQYKSDKRIKFVGTVYDLELLKKIRENAYGYFHGHEVGGTNPSLLEALSGTKLNLLYDVGFNKEVACDAALYWNKEEGNLASLIEKADQLPLDKINTLGEAAKGRIREAYSWDYICDRYKAVFINGVIDN